MEAVLSFFSHHPLMAVVLISCAIVVAVYFIRKHFWRIIAVGVLSLVLYYMYINGVFTKQNLEKIRAFDFNGLEKKAEKEITEGFKEVKSLKADTIEKTADSLRARAKEEMIPVIKEQILPPPLNSQTAAQSGETKTPAAKKSSAGKEPLHKTKSADKTGANESR